MGHDHSPESPQDISSHHMKVDRRYRESNYFLADQLRYSEDVQDFRSVKQSIARSPFFNLQHQVFQFAKISVEAD
jgi:hypothetical protein